MWEYSELQLELNVFCRALMCQTFFQVDTENTTKVSFSTTTEKIYSVKVMKTSRKSDYTVQKLKSSVVFATLDALLDEIKTSLNICPLQIGYIEPGHGLKGKQRWLIDDGDLTDMYCIYERKREITLWCQCGSAAGRSKQGTRGPRTGDQGPGTKDPGPRTQDPRPGTED